MKKIPIIIAVLFIGIISYIAINSKDTYAYNGYNSGTQIEGTVAKGFDWLYIENGPYVNVRDKVFVDTGIDRSIWSDNVELYFEALNSDDYFTVYLKDVDTDNPYFIVPETAKDGERYLLKSLNLFSSEVEEGYRIFTNQYIKEDDSRIYIDVHGSVSKIDDEIGKLNSFSFIDEKVSLKDNIKLKLNYTGNVEFMTVTLKNTKNDLVIERYINEYWTDNPYINLSSFINLTAGVYEIQKVSLCTTYNYENTCNSYDYEYYYDVFGENKYITIYDDNADISLKEIDILTNDKVVTGDRVGVYISADRAINNSLLVFSNVNDGTTFSVYVKGKDKDSYFLVPSTVNSGEYRIQSIVVKADNGSNQVVNVPNFEGNGYRTDGVVFNRVTLKIDAPKKDNNNNFIFNNEDFSEEIINKIKSLSNTAVITVICDNVSVLSDKLFSAIKETRKTLIVKYMDSEWVFNGKNIVITKPIDVSFFVNDVNNSNIIKNELFNKIDVNNLFVLSFSDNGDLPGKTLIRLKSTELDSKFGDSQAYVYYHDDENNNLLKVALEIQKSDGYYEFYINHNSNYVITTDKIDDKLVSEDESILKLNATSDKDNNVSNNNLNNNLFIIIGICLVIIITLLVVVISLKKRKNSK